MSTQQTRTPDVLSTSEAWALLRTTVVGRLAVSVGDQPEIFPVNYLVDHGSIIFRTAEGTKLAASIGRRVAFEVDAYDPSSGEAWSVVVKGTAREVTQLHEVLEALDSTLIPWRAAPKPRILRIEPSEVDGRRFDVMPEAERPPARPLRRAASE